MELLERELMCVHMLQSNEIHDKCKFDMLIRSTIGIDHVYTITSSLYAYELLAVEVSKPTTNSLPS